MLLVSAGSGRLVSPHLGIHSALRGTVMMPLRDSWPLPAPESCRRSRLHPSGHLLAGEHPGHTPFWLSEGTKESTLTTPRQHPSQPPEAGCLFPSPEHALHAPLHLIICSLGTLTCSGLNPESHHP